MEIEKLKELKERICCLTSNLDAAIDDYFKPDNSGETKETEKIHEYLNNAWTQMDAALDDLAWLIEGQEKKTDPPQDISKETFKKLLRNVTPETLQAANTAAVFFREQLDDEEELNLSKECQSAFIAVMLYEYGRLAAGKKEPAQAADQEEEGSKVPW